MRSRRGTRSGVVAGAAAGGSFRYSQGSYFVEQTPSIMEYHPYPHLDNLSFLSGYVPEKYGV